MYLGALFGLFWSVKRSLDGAERFKTRVKTLTTAFDPTPSRFCEFCILLLSIFWLEIDVETGHVLVTRRWVVRVFRKYSQMVFVLVENVFEARVHGGI